MQLYREGERMGSKITQPYRASIERGEVFTVSPAIPKLFPPLDHLTEKKKRNV